ncbi:MAG: hypothetical protein QM736_22565 [Vicinamibacterales bacterium]
MSASRSDVAPLAEVLCDAARGRREVTRDPLGRIVRVSRADGTAIRVEYDELGRLRSLDAGDVQLTHELRSERARQDLCVVDAAGSTDVRIGAHGWQIARRIDGESTELVLAASRLTDGRIREMRVPGSAAPLVFEYASSGCTIRSGGVTLARLVERGDRRRWRVAGGVLEERREASRWHLDAIGRNGRTCSTTVLTDFVGRTMQRTRSDGVREEDRRDADGRLSTHMWRANDASPWRTQTFDYEHHELATIALDGQTTIRETDDAGRVVGLLRADGTSTRYAYDARGRRVAASGPDGVTTDQYDGLDRLVNVVTPDGTMLFAEFDGLGRRVAVTGPEGRVLEHRDAEGRLWAVTDPSGRALATYVWFEERVLLRIDGALDEGVCTAYLTDPLGTPLLALDATGAPAFLDAAPYGSVDDARRPTLYGHFGDPRTGLIHCGARELDPESCTFLTPEPWHGGADDERRWAEPAHARADVREEGGVGRRHDYALCRFDPVGRADYDGHVSGGAIAAAIFRGLGNIVLAPTWGWPLTAISLFFFLPFNLYAELIAGIVAIFIQRHPWKNHTIFALRGMFGSLRQGQLSFALNGFLPRVISGGGIHGDRAVTIGNVIWINRHELHSLDRPLVVEVDDIAAAGGGSLVAFNSNANVASVVALEIADSDGKKRVHVTYWSRGYGNAIKSVPGTGGAAPALAFDDREVGGKRPGTLLLAQPVPLDWDPPDETDDKEKLVVREFVRRSTDPEADVVLEDNLWFALQLEQHKNEKLKAGDAVEIEADADLHLNPAHQVVGKVQDLEDFSLVFLLGNLPARFRTASVSKDMIVHRLTDDASIGATGDWQDTSTTGPRSDGARVGQRSYMAASTRQGRSREGEGGDGGDGGADAWHDVARAGRHRARASHRAQGDARSNRGAPHRIRRHGDRLHDGRQGEGAGSEAPGSQRTYGDRVRRIARRHLEGRLCVGDTVRAFARVRARCRGGRQESDVDLPLDAAGLHRRSQSPGAQAGGSRWRRQSEGDDSESERHELRDGGAALQAVRRGHRPALEGRGYRGDSCGEADGERHAHAERRRARHEAVHRQRCEARHDALQDHGREARGAAAVPQTCGRCGARIVRRVPDCAHRGGRLERQADGLLLSAAAARHAQVLLAHMVTGGSRHEQLLRPRSGSAAAAAQQRDRQVRLGVRSGRTLSRHEPVHHDWRASSSRMAVQSAFVHAVERRAWDRHERHRAFGGDNRSSRSAVPLHVGRRAAGARDPSHAAGELLGSAARGVPAARRDHEHRQSRGTGQRRDDTRVVPRHPERLLRRLASVSASGRPSASAGSCTWRGNSSSCRRPTSPRTRRRKFSTRTSRR